jgi:hypothetical protein
VRRGDSDDDEILCDIRRHIAVIIAIGMEFT